MKKLLTSIMALSMMISLAMPIALHARELVVFIDGVRIDFDGQAPTWVNNFLLVPVRGVFEHLGFDVRWDASAQKAIMTRGDEVVTIRVGDRDAHMPSGARRDMLTPAQLINDRMFARLRIVVAYLGLDETLDNVAGTLTLTTLQPFGGSEFVGLWHSVFWTYYDDEGTANILDIAETPTSRYIDFLPNGVMVTMSEGRVETGRDGRDSFAWTARIEDDMLILQPIDSTSTWHLERVRENN